MDQPLAQLKTIRTKVTKRPATDTRATYLHVSLPDCSMIFVAYDYAASDPFLAALQVAIADHHGVIIEPRDAVLVHQAGASSYYDVTYQTEQARERAHA